MINTTDLLNVAIKYEPHRFSTGVTPDGQPLYWVKVDGQWQSIRPVINRDPVLNGFEQAIVERAIRQSILQKPQLNLSIHLARRTQPSVGVEGAVHRERSVYEVYLEDEEHSIASSNSAPDLVDALLLTYTTWLDTLEFQRQVQAGEVTVPGFTEPELESVG